MRLTKRFMVGVLLASGAGLVAAGIPYQAGYVRAEAGDPFAIQVPVGRFGDELRYAGTWNYTYSGYGEEGDGEGRSDRRFTLEGPVRAIDRSSVELDAVRWVESDFRYEGSLGTSASNTTTYSIDIESRRDIRRDSNREWEGEVQGLSLFGPGLDYGLPDYVDLDLQGKSLHLGQNVSYRELGDPDYDTPYNHRPLGGQQWGEISARATVDGVPTLVYEKRLREFGVYDRSQETSLLGSTHRLHYAAGSPYPLLAEYSEYELFWGPDGTPTWEYHAQEVMWLEEYSPGDEPIPWGRDNNATSLVMPERALGADRSLADGSGAKIAFPLADAIATLATDPGGSGFREWAASRDERLVGAHYVNMPSWIQPAGTFDLWTGVTWRNTWILFFADEAQNVVFVWLNQHGSARMVADDATPVKLPESASISFEDLPEDPLTIGGARAMLDALLAPEDRALPTDSVTWGLAHVLPYGSRPLIGAPPSYEASYAGPAALHLQPLTITVRERPLLDSTTLPAPELPRSRTGLRLNVETGEMRSMWSSEQFPTLNLPQPAAGAAPTAMPVESGSSAPVVSPFPMAALGASTFLAVFLAVYFYPLLKFLGTNAVVAFPGYAKLQRSGLLTHALRDAIVQHVRADPGITPPQLQASTGAAWSTIVYHLSVLEKNRILSSFIDGRHKRFFPADTTDWSNRHRVAALKNDRTKEAYSIILEEPGVARGDLADRLGVSVPAVAWHIDRLERAGLVAHDALGRRFRYYAVEARAISRPAEPERGIEIA